MSEACPRLAGSSQVESPGSMRLTAVDALRGAVMVIMALDHARDFVHAGAMTFSPEDLTQTTALLFLTRWVTHLCAPTFMFTAGLGAFFWWQRGKTRGQLSTYLLTRGLWLLLLEVTVMRLAYNFTLSGQYPMLLLVLWALGACMVALALLVWVPRPLLAAMSLTAIALHNTLDGVTPADFASWAGVWNLLHQPGAFSAGSMTLIVGYPLIPWMAVMTLGFCFGPVFLREGAVRRRWLTIAGAAAIVAFAAIRAINGFGDPVPWSVQDSPTLTALSMLNTTKYPPSLAFLLMTLGPALLLLAWFDRRPALPSLVVFGRVPLFYFVLHFFAAHAIAVLLAVVGYGSSVWRFAFHPVPSMGGPAALFPPQFGHGLGVVFLVWGLLVLGLYPLCHRFAALKATRRDWWLSYL